VAVELPEGVRVHLTEVQQRLKPEVKSASWTRLENLHVTLKFLGEVEERRITDVTDALKQLAPVGEMTLWSEGVTCFPPGHGVVRIVSAGFRGEVGPLEALYRQVEDRCAELGFNREGRAYRPHATLARPRALLASGARARLEAAARGCWPGPEFRVSELVLMESRLRHEGSEYIPLARYPVT
jgi:2'-5' RNA ligase